MLTSVGKVPGTQMNCPVCKSKDARRSHRQYMADHIFSLVGVYPWRCRNCEARFHARLMTLSDSLHAHCPVCGNHELKRISGEHVKIPFSFLWRWLSIPAYRCEPCRHKYFSILPYRMPEEEFVEMSSAD
jgi:C4-type Zn-finger protein